MTSKNQPIRFVYLYTPGSSFSPAKETDKIRYVFETESAAEGQAEIDRMRNPESLPHLIRRFPLLATPPTRQDEVAWQDAEAKAEALAKLTPRDRILLGV